MSTLRITKKFTFEMAHALHGHNGKCANIHGHSYRMEVTVIGKPVADEEDASLGMVMDFSALKKIVNEEIIAVFDHALALKDTHPIIQQIRDFHENIVALPYQPTCENLLIDFAGRIDRHIRIPLKLYSILLRETPTSYASWYAEDNS